ncbi:lantibiotic dehydratase [Streptomyces kronopolitis]|uniref:lantibiotic dehydratase n=1 Tax=Streptomyces kronopolitis TaxID=1612435 RepID=UPI0036ADC16D
MRRTPCADGRQASYAPAGFFLLRAPALPFETFECLAECGSREQTQSVLRELGGDPHIQRALEVAGSELVEALRRIAEDPAATGKRTRRAYAGLLRYVTRMATRATPFGSFAGVALGEFGVSSAVRLGSRSLGDERVRADMGWLMAWVRQLERDPTALQWLRLKANDTAYYVGDKIVVPLAEFLGEGGFRSVSMRATPPVRQTMLSATGVPYEQLVESVCTSFPQAGRDRAENLVKRLFELHVITSDLRPPLGEPHPDQWLLNRLENRAGDGPSERAAELREVVALARSSGNGDLRTLRGAQRTMVPEYGRQTYQLDSALDVCGARLSGQVASEVAEAANCLLRLTAADRENPLGTYHAAFRERYSGGALVPVRELLSPERGLDAPPGYKYPSRSSPLERLAPPTGDESSDRDQALCEIAVRALRTGTVEAELTDELVYRLAPEGDPAMGDLTPVTALDVFVQIQADSPAAIDGGDWRAVVTGTASGGGTCGRFSDLLGSEANSLLARHAACEEQQSPEVAFAELSYLPLAEFVGNVAISPRLHTYEIPVNTTPSLPADRVIAVDDILVGATHTRLYLWSRRLNREIVVTQNHRLHPGNAPNVCRFLLDVSRQNVIAPVGFPWGSMKASPFLPRIVRGRIVLSPARWRVSESLLGGKPTEMAPDDFAAAVTAWRKTWGVPRLAQLFEIHDPLTVDLEQPLCLDELQAALRRRPDGLVVQEPPAQPGQLWLRDEKDRAYTTEVVVPLINRQSAPAAHRRPQPAPRAAVATVGSMPRERHLPGGGSWTSLNLYSAPDQHDEIIAGLLRDCIAICDEQGLTDRWFFIRYADPRPHLRVRLRARATGTAEETLAELLALGRHLTDCGLANDFSIVSYDPEIERYGGGTAFDHVEQAFDASSRMTTELIAKCLSGDSAMDPDCVTVAVLDALYTHWGLSLDQRLCLAPEPAANEKEQSEARAVFHAHRDYLCSLLSPLDNHEHLQGLNDRKRLLPTLLTQQPAIAKAATAVQMAAADDSLWGTEASILSSLVHMQVNRLLPIDRAREHRCYLLWRHTLRAIRGRRHAALPPEKQ